MVRCADKGLVGGPDRPMPAPKPQRPNASAAGASGAGGRPQPNRANSVSDMANSASRGVSDLYSRLNNALAERGYVVSHHKTLLPSDEFSCSEMLSGLEESFQSLESGSKNMLNQVRKDELQSLLEN